MWPFSPFWKTDSRLTSFVPASPSGKAYCSGKREIDNEVRQKANSQCSLLSFSITTKITRLQWQALLTYKLVHLVTNGSRISRHVKPLTLQLSADIWS